MTSTDELSLGQVVSSRAGRDRGRYFVVVEILDDRFVAVADGDLRKVENPKKKNVRHLLVHNDVLPLGEKLRAGERVSNAELRKMLKAYQSKER